MWARENCLCCPVIRLPLESHAHTKVCDDGNTPHFFIFPFHPQCTSWPLTADPSLSVFGSVVPSSPFHSPAQRRQKSTLRQGPRRRQLRGSPRRFGRSAHPRHGSNATQGWKTVGAYGVVTSKADAPLFFLQTYIVFLFA